MEQDKLIERINFLAKKKKEEGLSEKELQEQKELREEYLKRIRVNLKSSLDNTVFMKEIIVDKDKIDIKKIEDDSAIVKIEEENDKYKIYYDIKKINEKVIFDKYIKN